MTEKEEFFRSLEALGETGVRSRAQAGNRSPYQRRHMDRAREWLDEMDRRRADEKVTTEAADRKTTLEAQKHSNQLNRYTVWIYLGLLLAAVAALYLGK